MFFKKKRIVSKILIVLIPSFHENKIELIEEIIEDFKEKNPHAWKVVSASRIAKGLITTLVQRKFIDISEVKKEYRAEVILAVAAGTK